jgi:hypothetical protein
MVDIVFESVGAPMICIDHCPCVCCFRKALSIAFTTYMNPIKSYL